MSKGSFRPRRGKRATAISKGIVLKSGEIFFEVPASGIGTAPGNIVMGDGTTAYEDLPYYTESGSGFGTVTSVNNIAPDTAGNVTLTSVPYAENILSSDNLEQTETYIFRTAGGSSDINSGDADLDKIKGNCEIDENTGAISVAKPTSFKAIGLNQFNKSTMMLSGYTVSAAGKVTAQSGSYVCFAHVVGGLDTGYIAFDSNASITRIGGCDAAPTTSTSGITVTVDNVFVTVITNNATKSIICNTQEGYVVVACTNNTKLCIHPKWSGSADNEYADYSESVLTLPTKDADNNNLPLATYGMPSVNDVRDEMNLAQKTYTQRIGYYPYSAQNLVNVEAYGTPFIYDDTYIFYVLKNPIVYTLPASTSTAYTVHDFGTEEFLGTTVGVVSTTVYGENLKDKLRRDVVTISKQNLTANQRNQVRTNIDAAQNYLQFTEAEDAPNQTLLNTIVSGNPMNTLFGASKRLLRRLDAQVSSKISSVNQTLHDESGNVDITRVPLADNIYSPDNNENYEGYIYRTSGGTSDLNSGEAQLSFIRGNLTVSGRIEESLEATYTSTHEPEEGEEYDQPNVIIDAATWRASSLGSASGTYTFTYDGSDWKYNSGAVTLATYGMTVTGDLYATDYITVVYVKANRGTLVTIKPTSFVSIGLNQFNKSNMILSNYTINSSGAIVAQSGSYVAYCKAPYSNAQGWIAYDSNSTISRIGYIDTVPAAGKTVSLTGAAVTAQIATTTGVPTTSADYSVGYVAVACTNINGICIHPRWSGGEDTNYKAYSASTITIPTKDASNNNLPFVSYGLPAVGSVADEINFDLKEYIQRVGHYAYSAANLATVQAMGVDYDYDTSHIFYVLANPVRIALNSSVSGIYTVHDYGTEHLEYSAGVGTTALAASTNLLISCDHLYGQNLRDKLRRDVLTISAQTLSDSEKTQVLTNIGAASAASVTQLNNDIYNSYLNYNGIYQYKNLGTFNSSNIESLFTSLSLGTNWNVRVGNYVTLNDGIYNSMWQVAHIDRWRNTADYRQGYALNPSNTLTLIPRDYLAKVDTISDPTIPDINLNLIAMNSTNTTDVSKNPNNPLYTTTQGVETAGYQCYFGCDFNQIVAPAISAQMGSLLGSHLKTYFRILLSNSIDMTAQNKNHPDWKGWVKGWAWYDVPGVFLPSEHELYGASVWSNGAYDVGLNCEKLAMFNFVNHVQYSRPSYWLRSGASSSYFSYAHNGGLANCNGASNRLYCRPLLIVG